MFLVRTVTIVNNLELTAVQRRDVGEIVQAISQYVEGQINEFVVRHHFCQHCQQPGESFDNFLVSLQELAKTCNFCSDKCMQKGIWDQIVEGLLDGDAIEDLLKERELSLDTAISKCRAKKAARQQREEITNVSSESTLVQAVQKAPKNISPRPSSAMCQGCGSGHHQGGHQNCPAYHVICHNCNKSGHFARVCWRRRRKQPPTPLAPHLSHPMPVK